MTSDAVGGGGGRLCQKERLQAAGLLTEEAPSSVSATTASMAYVAGEVGAAMKPNYVLRSWRSGGQTLGAWLDSADAFTAENMGAMGWDWLVVDLQHGLLDYSDMVPMLQAISTTNTVPFVRVPWRDTWQIDRALDAGAMGVIVPLVNNAAQAADVVRAMKYPNNRKTPGIRSCGPVRSMGLYGAEHMERADDEMAVICQIETAEALENVESIAATPGVDALYIGPTDLAFGLGVFPEGGSRWWGQMFSHPDHIAAVARVREVAHKHGIAAIMHVLNNTEHAARYLEAGFNGVMVGAARAWMMSAAGTALRSLREKCPTVIPPRLTASDTVLEALAEGTISLADAKKAMARL